MNNNRNQLILTQGHFITHSILTTVGLAIAVTTFTVNPAQAFTLNFDPGFGTSNPQGTGATAKLDFNFIQSGSDVLLNLGITNTTNGSSFLDGVKTTGANQATFMGFGFDLLAGISVKSFTGNSFFGHWLPNVELSPFGTYDVGIAKNQKLTGGNTHGGLTAGQSTSVSLLLGTSLNAAAVESGFLSGFTNKTLGSVARFQSVGWGNNLELSDKLLGGIINPVAIQPAPVVQAPAPVVQAPAPVVQAPAPAPEAPVPAPPLAVPTPPSGSWYEEKGDMRSVPEPSSLVGLALFGMGVFGTKRRQQRLAVK